MKIGLISDTHGYLDPAVFKHFENCDEIWHAGDIGSVDVLEALKEFKPTKAVWGNIDDHVIRAMTAEDSISVIEGYKIFITHIGGSPPKYNPISSRKILDYMPQLFVCGHSHICKVQYDKKFNMLYMNPGAAGRHGFHQTRTLLRFDISAEGFKNLEVVELGPRSEKTKKAV